MLLDGRTVARNEFARNYEKPRRICGGIVAQFFDGAKQKAVARLSLTTAFSLFVERELELEARSELHLEHRARVVSEQQLANSR